MIIMGILIWTMNEFKSNVEHATQEIMRSYILDKSFMCPFLTYPHHLRFFP